GYRVLLIIGNVLLVLSGLLLALLNESHGFLYVFCTMFIQGLSFGLTSTVGIIGSQQLADAHEKGIATSFFMFCRNIGTAIGVTIMGAFLTKAADFMTGIHHLFLFGFIGSIVALVTSLFIRDESEQEKNNLLRSGEML
ncbi:MFS transporter, partial [Parageobacillus thermoglucosidasius]